MDIYTATEQAYKNGYEKGYEAGKKAATDNNVGHKWIPVSERLPEKDREVLCLLDTGSYWLARWNHCDDSLWSDGDFWSSEKFVTHWMPLPEPPKEV